MKRSQRRLNAERRIGICGHFGGANACLDGQTVKTKNVAAGLKKMLGEEQVLTVDTYGGARALLHCLSGSLRLLQSCEHVIILPAQNGVRIFPPFLVALNHIYHRKLHYIVIGGWLPELVREKRKLAGVLKKLDGIYVETSTMKRALEGSGFTNAIVLPNFKDLQILRPEELTCQTQAPYKLCTFSRVMREKGIEDAVGAVKAVNEEAGRVVYTLDIFGQVNAGYADDFARLQGSFPAYVCYRGAVPSEESVGTLKGYFALLFPTHFFTEGIPGTIIDAYAAGVPVISSRWESFADVVEEGRTGIGFSFEHPEELEAILRRLSRHPQQLNDMKRECLCRAQEYTPDSVLRKLLDKLV